MPGISNAEIVRGVVDGAAVFIIAVWDAVAASPKLQIALVVFVALSLVSGGTGGRRRMSRLR